ncbi:probable C-mannosyltransferase DPY19L4 isoform X2 [Gambusia affinis]|uniref:probable C-mannosyltransferase DPY19L4 isoform X2 n=1 Tax=Gambusia affinis TaxID=33528 RepID=UPI001CDD01B2|nr:probable C-mannosyltransferase DPY19L4 isoform X2 [Gambusia affinis]
MAEIRCRKSAALEGEAAEESRSVAAEEEEERRESGGDEDGQERVQPSKQKPAAASLLQSGLRMIFGAMAAVACGMLYAGYLSGFHDRKFWFSSRQELEREASFPGGSGLYYHYYKRLLAAPSFSSGFYELTADNGTVSGRTINAVERLFLYPELITSFLYRVTGSQNRVEPVSFYLGSVFGLQAVCVSALFVCSWALSGTCVAGMLAVSWFVINRQDASRVEQGVPLRENWALPFFSCQVAALTGFLSRSTGSASEMFCYLMLSACSFSFLLLWELGHYFLFVQGVCLVLLDSLGLVPPRKTADVYRAYLGSLVLVYLAQFQNASLLGSPLLSLLIGSVPARYFQMKMKMKMGHLGARVMKMLLHVQLVFSCIFTCSFLVKKLLPASGADFTLQVLEAKLGLNSTADFVINFLLCQEALRAPGQDLFLRLTQTSLLPFYILVLTVCLLSALQAAFRRVSGQPISSSLSLEDGRIGEQPAVAYHLLHTLLLGVLTLLFDGVKYLWTPYVCMFTAFGVCSPDLWMTLFKWLRLKSVHPVVLSLILSTAVPTIIGFSLWREFYPRVLAELADLQEIYDPDLMELIAWIRSQAPAVFAGSPVLLGTIKLCSGSVVTSLPVYSDLDLLRRTEDTFQVYAMMSAEDVYKRLAAHGTAYVVVEESICSDVQLRTGCRVKDLLDAANGQAARSQTVSFSKHGRFCQEVKMNYSPYTNYFTRVFWNRSYHVYRVNPVISFQY